MEPSISCRPECVQEADGPTRHLFRQNLHLNTAPWVVWEPITKSEKRWLEDFSLSL